MIRTPKEPGEKRGASIEYRLARRRLIADYESGRQFREDLCDAHPELLRAAKSVGIKQQEPCPICSEETLANVTYVFGPRLPIHGRCITLGGELQRLAKRSGRFIAYQVECCTQCRWHHLIRQWQLKNPDN